MRSGVHVVVMPEPGTEEMADCNWITWMVVGHVDPSKVQRDVLQTHVKNFFRQERPEPSDNAQWGIWKQGQPLRFLDYMDIQGYTTYEPSRLEWCVDQ